MLLNTACRKIENQGCASETGLGSYSRFPIGCAISPDTLAANSSYKKIVDEQFNSLTAENVFKASFIHPAEKVFDWRQSDDLVNYAQQMGKHVHGHTLIWHSQLPAWIENFKGTENEWDELFRDHIQTITQQYQGKIRAWDVVNEAFNDDGTLRETIWLQHMGPDYIEKAFRYCHAADPDALLFYNDYLLEMSPLKRKAVLDLLDGLREKGVKVDGIGMQMHISTSYPEMQQIAEALSDVARHNYLVHLSEIDISVNPFAKKVDDKKTLFKRQAEILGTVIFHYKSIPAQLQYGVTFWGVSDRDSWIRTFYDREDYPLLFDDDYQPKPAYCTLKDLL